MSAFRIVVLASGTGTNLQAILDQLHGRDGIEVVGVGSDKPEARALERAREAGVETAVFPARGVRRPRGPRRRDGRLDRGAAAPTSSSSPATCSCSARRSSPASATASSTSTPPCCRPSPASTRSARRSRRGSSVTGVTVHFVDEGVDTGPPILQREVPVPAGRDREELEEAIHAVEHELYPEAIRMIAQGRVRIDADDPRVSRLDE